MIRVHLVGLYPAFHPNNAKILNLHNLDKSYGLLLRLFVHILIFCQQLTVPLTSKRTWKGPQASNKYSFPHLKIIFTDSFSPMSDRISGLPVILWFLLPRIRTCLGCNELAFSGTGNILGAAASSMQKSLKKYCDTFFFGESIHFSRRFFRGDIFQII